MVQRFIYSSYKPSWQPGRFHGEKKSDLHVELLCTVVKSWKYSMSVTSLRFFPRWHGYNSEGVLTPSWLIGTVSYFHCNDFILCSDDYDEERMVLCRIIHDHRMCISFVIKRTRKYFLLKKSFLHRQRNF